MDKDSYVLQTTRTGRLATNAVFADEASARAEAERACASGAFELVRLTQMNGGTREVLFEVGAPKRSKQAAAAPGPVKKKRGLSGPALIRRASGLITVALIIGVLWYLATPYFK